MLTDDATAARRATIPIRVMTVAVVTSKLAILLGPGIGPFRVRQLPCRANWGLAHESRTGSAMVPGARFFRLAGPGPWSLDARPARRRAAGAVA